MSNNSPRSEPSLKRVRYCIAPATMIEVIRLGPIPEELDAPSETSASATT